MPFFTTITFLISNLNMGRLHTPSQVGHADGIIKLCFFIKKKVEKKVEIFFYVRIFEKLTSDEKIGQKRPKTAKIDVLHAKNGSM